MNAGYFFYKEYYQSAFISEDNLLKHFDPRKFREKNNVENKEKNKKISKKNLAIFESKNQELKEYNPEQYLIDILKLGDESFLREKQTISLETIYPGLVLGTGYNHETGFEGEHKLGFFFDYTTGLPIIPGSSVKGKLRSVFPWYNNTKVTEKDEKALYIWNTLSFFDSTQFDFIKEQDFYSEKNIKKKEKIHQIISLLEFQIFDGLDIEKSSDSEKKYLSIYNRDTFYDATLSAPNSKGFIFDNDFITPHLNRAHPELSPFTNPIPLQFLKILPKVQFLFQFDLKETVIDELKISSKLKCDLFKQILIDFGIGAKTNVGYGQFEISHRKKVSNLPENEVPLNIQSILKKGATFSGKIKSQVGEYNIYSFLAGKVECSIRKKRSDKISDLKIGDNVIIEFANNYTPENSNMKVKRGLEVS